eukprot:gene9738-11949_t
MEIARIKTKGRFPISAVATGLGVVLPPESVLAMFIGALVFWLMAKKHKTAGTQGHRVWVEGMEPICAGLISGAALMGIGNAIINKLPADQAPRSQGLGRLFHVRLQKRHPPLEGYEGGCRPPHPPSTPPKGDTPTVARRRD